MPAFLFKIMNPLMKAMLNSPLHGRVSRELMVLTFTGRKTGKRYSTPVGYVRSAAGAGGAAGAGDEIYVLTHSAWWKNFRSPTPVTMRIQGRDVQGAAQVVEDAEGIKAIVREMLAARDEKMARQLGYWTDDVNAPAEKVARDVQGTIFIRIKLPGNAR